MRITGGKIYALRIPFVEAFAHSAQTRAFSDSFVVRLVCEDGTTGFGEGAARPFVTGETVESSIEYIKKRLFPVIEEFDFQEIYPQPNALEAFAPVNEILPEERSSGGVIWNAARSAVELALIDCLLKSQNRSLTDILPPGRNSVIYSGVITAGKIETAVRHAKSFKFFGIKQLKIKIGSGDDYARLAAVRDAVGEETSLRLDANGAFDVRSAIAVSQKLSHFKIDAFEQPIPRGKAQDLAEVKRNSPLPVMADESLVTAEDAEKLIKLSACDFFNLRISKCGGIFNVLKLAQIGKQAGIRLQLGCQVGETAILSAAGRSVAAYLETPEFVEGSYGNLLLAEDVSRENISFGHGGRAPLLRGLGLGIRVRDEILEKYAHRVTNLGKELRKICLNY
jgi:muconate cycloisomerase